MNASIPIPVRMANLPKDPHRGVPVPWFVAWIDGAPDFRVIRIDGVAEAFHKAKCWLCGQPLGRFRCFVIGPMCVINRTTAEPPCHRECAEYAARACPFLANPRVQRQTHNLPENILPPAGEHIDRNPGVAAIWIVEATNARLTYQLMPVVNGWLIRLGPNPAEVTWFREGRAATRPEVYDSIAAGLPLLLDLARREGPDAVEALKRYTRSANRLLPALRPEDVVIAEEAPP